MNWQPAHRPYVNAGPSYWASIGDIIDASSLAQPKVSQRAAPAPRQIEGLPTQPPLETSMVLNTDTQGEPWQIQYPEVPY